MTHSVVFAKDSLQLQPESDEKYRRKNKKNGVRSKGKTQTQ
jgi:hypothetical protein